MKESSCLGITLSGIYLVVSVFLISTQGLFGESFITIILGLPWTLALSFIEYGDATGSLLYFLALLPIFINTLLLYWIGKLIAK